MRRLKSVSASQSYYVLPMDRQFGSPVNTRQRLRDAGSDLQQARCRYERRTGGRQVGVSMNFASLKDTAAYKSVAHAIVSDIFKSKTPGDDVLQSRFGALIYQLLITLCELFLRHCAGTYEALDPETLLTIEILREQPERQRNVATAVRP